MTTQENPAGNHPSSRVLLCNTVSLYLMAYNHSYWWPWSNAMVMKTEQRTNLKCQLFSSSFGKNFLKIKSKRHYSKNDDWNSTDSLSAKILMYVMYKTKQALRPAFTMRSAGSFRCLFLLSLICDKYAKVDFMI